MKYFVRAVKYFFYFAFITAAIVLALVLIGAVEGDINSIFEDGYDSLWKIALFFVCVAAVYPRLAFINRDVSIGREWDEISGDVKEFFRERRYETESEEDGVVTFRLRSKGARLAKMCEDRLILRKTAAGYSLEGLRKDALHIAAALEHRFSDPAGE